MIERCLKCYAILHSLYTACGALREHQGSRCNEALRGSQVVFAYDDPATLLRNPSDVRRKRILARSRRSISVFDAGAQYDWHGVSIACAISAVTAMHRKLKPKTLRHVATILKGGGADGGARKLSIVNLN